MELGSPLGPTEPGPFTLRESLPQSRLESGPRVHGKLSGARCVLAAVNAVGTEESGATWKGAKREALWRRVTVAATLMPRPRRASPVQPRSPTLSVHSPARPGSPAQRAPRAAPQSSRTAGVPEEPRPPPPPPPPSVLGGCRPLRASASLGAAAAARSLPAPHPGRREGGTCGKEVAARWLAPAGPDQTLAKEPRALRAPQATCSPVASPRTPGGAASAPL